MIMKNTVIHHSADFDGIFCREIARKFLPPNTEFIGWDYKDQKLKFPDGIVYILDLSPECFEGLELQENWENLDRVIWIDHHKTAIDKFSYKIEGYRIDGVAACRLAWQWFSYGLTDGREPMKVCVPEKSAYIDRNVSEPLAVRLVGEYDIWDKRDERTDTFQYGLRSRELTESDWRNILSSRQTSIEEIEGLISVGHQNLIEPDGTSPPAIVHQLLDAGRILQRYAQTQNESLVKNLSFIVEWEGLKFLTLNTGMFNSLVFTSKDKPETGHDALMGFKYDGKQWNFSLYHAEHNKGIDLSLIASKYGGGGHRGACGFRSEKIPFIP